MTDPISPAEAAAANAIDATNAQNANSDLAGTAEPEPTEQQLADHAHALEAQLAAIQARKALAGQGVPHAHIVPATAEHKATDVPVVHPAVAAVAAKPAAVANPTLIPAAASPGVVEVAVSHSAKLAQLQAEGKAVPKKRVYAYQRKRK